MALDTIIMVVLICVGVALMLAGLIYVAIAGGRLAKAAREAGIASVDEVRIVMRKVEGLAPRLRDLKQKQEVVAERLEDLSATTSKLNYLKDEFERATAHMTHLKS
jgi:hypothetical protein